MVGSRVEPVNVKHIDFWAFILASMLFMFYILLFALCLVGIKSKLLLYPCICFDPLIANCYLCSVQAQSSKEKYTYKGNICKLRI